MQPIFNGTPEDTKEWLEKNAWAHEADVCIGRTMKIVSVKEYLKQNCCIECFKVLDHGCSDKDCACHKN